MHPEEVICKCCRNSRDNDGKPPRIRIPIYREDADPMYLCDYCDGDALRATKTLETERLAGE